MENLVLRIIEAYKRRLFKKLKKRSPVERLKARTYYRTHKNKILLNRRRYQHKTSPFKKTKKFFKRTTPSWMHGTKHPHPVKPKGPQKAPSYKPKHLKTILKRPIQKVKNLLKGK